MFIKKTVAWWLLNSKPHPRLTNKEQTIESLPPMLGAMFPGISYYSVRDFNLAFQQFAIPALKVFAPNMLGVPADSVDDETIEITEVIPSDGYEWQEDESWCSRFQARLAELGAT